MQDTHPFRPSTHAIKETLLEGTLLDFPMAHGGKGGIDRPTMFHVRLLLFIRRFWHVGLPQSHGSAIVTSSELCIVFGAHNLYIKDVGYRFHPLSNAMAFPLFLQTVGS